MIEGLKKLYTGEKAFSRQLILFSICGSLGLFNAFIGFEKQGLVEVTQLHKYIYFVLWMIFMFFLTGYETLFLHERHIPDIDLRSLKIVFNKILFFVFLISIPLALVSFKFQAYTSVAFALEIILSIPLTMLQAGYSYNFKESDACMFFARLCIKEYFILMLKRLWIICLAYIITFGFVFLLFFTVGLVIALIYKGDFNTIGLIISSQQLVIAKLSSFIAGVVLIYALTVGTLVWDYELIKTFER